MYDLFPPFCRGNFVKPEMHCCYFVPVMFWLFSKMYLITDNCLFLKFCNLTQTDLETQCQLGTSCSSKVISRNRVAIAKENLSVCSDVIKEAIEKYAITLMIDDYHNIHSIQTPTDEATSKVDDICTIIIKIVKEATAIPLSSVNLTHNPSGTDILFL